MAERANIARMVERLDHPDAIHQREVMDAIIAFGPQAIEPLAANLVLSNGRVQTALVQILGEFEDSRAVLPLMRFVWDSRGKIESSNARALAMKSLVRLVNDDEAPRMVAFLMDVSDDQDPFVRGWAAEALGKFGDRRAEPILRELARDDEEFVSEKAQRALASLDDSTSDAISRAARELSDFELLGKIRSERGAEQQFWLAELASRPNAFELASDLVRGGGRAVIYGLRMLQRLRDPRARGVAVALLTRSPENADIRAVATRLMAAHLAGDADDNEAEIIRSLSYDDDRFVRMAASEASGASGKADLVSRALQVVSSGRDADQIQAAARGLSLGLSSRDRGRFPDLSDAFATVHNIRVQSDDPAWAEAEAYLLRAIRRLVEGQNFGQKQAQTIALRALHDAAEKRPLVVTGIELLETSTPEDGLESDARWSRDQAISLVEVLESAQDADIVRRTLELMVRGVPDGMISTIDILERLAWNQEFDIPTSIVPLLKKAGSRRAMDLLQDLANSEDEEVRLAAETALRQKRNSEDVIDAEFEAENPATAEREQWEDDASWE